MPDEKSVQDHPTSPTIMVTGDLTADWLHWSVAAKEYKGPAKQTPPNWQLFRGTGMAVTPGGAWQLAKMVEAATGLTVLAPAPPQELAKMPPHQVLRSHARLSLFPAETAKDQNLKQENTVFRVHELLGYDGPQSGAMQAVPLDPQDLKAKADLVVIDDAGNGFRDHPKDWPQALEDENTWVILKRSRPLHSGKLWQKLLDRPERLVVVISADDLRSEGQEGVNISRRLSWERTAKDLYWQISTNPNIGCLFNLHHLVVRFGLDGAVYFCHDWDGLKARLFYDPLRVEDDFAEESCQGRMTGLTNAFVAALVGQMVKQGLNSGDPKGLREGIRAGIQASRRLLLRGFGDHEAPTPFDAETFTAPKGKTSADAVIAEILIPSQQTVDEPDPYGWLILQDLAGSKLTEMAEQIVRLGVEPQAAIIGAGTDTAVIPAARFGDLVTLDRTEMQSLRSIKNIMTEYLRKPQNKPLSIAVFGPPGAGKSFAVTEVAKSIQVEGIGIENLEFNLSQWDSPRDLINALHRVRDVVLGGAVPLVFFDEFDAALQGEPLGWLKYFLDPMQSGKFKEGESIHPLGKTIFVFAGGTSHSLQEFSRKDRGEETQADHDDRKKFKMAKGPDFVSRLKGYVNILGVNRNGPTDHLYRIRRAVILRNILVGMAKKRFPELLTAKKELRIHASVLTSLLMAPEYKHGVRSLEAILNMSALSGRRVIEQAALPPETQLELHVDAPIFRRLPALMRIVQERRDTLARAIHEKYLEEQQGKKPPEDPSMQPWGILAEYLQDSNRGQAEQIPEKLLAVGCCAAPTGNRPLRPFTFTEPEVEFLAEMEHDRWMKEKLADKWTYGPKKISEGRIHHCLLAWELLDEPTKDIDRQAVGNIPGILQAAGFEIQRVRK